VVPTIDATAKSRLRAIYLKGQKLKNRPGVFAKAGDSITASWSFLVDVGCGSEQLGAYHHLADTIQFFRATALKPTTAFGSGWCTTANAFTARSISADSGWASDDAVRTLAIRALPAGCGARANTPFLCELKRKRPSIVFIMYGTNDLERAADTAIFQRNLTTMVHQSLAAGVIPVLSTIPPRTDSFSSRVDNYNQAIISVAQHNQVPLWNYWRVFQRVDLVDNGLDPDGIHPNVYQQDQGADFGQIALQYGYNQRNLTAIQILDLIRNVVILDGPPT
jgi:hypothetical protein